MKLHTIYFLILLLFVHCKPNIEQQFRDEYNDEANITWNQNKLITYEDFKLLKSILKEESFHCQIGTSILVKKKGYEFDYFVGMNKEKSYIKFYKFSDKRIEENLALTNLLFNLYELNARKIRKYHLVNKISIDGKNPSKDINFEIENEVVKAQNYYHKIISENDYDIDFIILCTMKVRDSIYSLEEYKADIYL